MRQVAIPAVILTLLFPLAASASDAAAQAKHLLQMTGLQGGFVVHVGCGDGRLTAALRGNERFLVQGLETCPTKLKTARENIRSQGIYGRVSAVVWDGKRLPYADNLVNLLVVEDRGELTDSELLRVVAPCGSVCVKKDGAWSHSVKPWPEDIDQWTHWLHGPDGNAVAHDRVAGPPRGLQWITGPIWSRHHNTVPSVTAQVTAGGRLFYIVDEAPASMDGSAPDKWALAARDAFNGVLLWRKPIDDWGWKAWSAHWTRRFTVPTHIPSRLVAVGERVYVTLGFNAPLSELDAATGKVVRTYAGSEFTDEVLYEAGKLLLVVNHGRQSPGLVTEAEKRGKPNRGDDEPKQPTPVHKSVAMFDAQSGRMLWKSGDFIGLRSKTGSMERISHLSLVAGGGQVFFADEEELVCLSTADGRECWRVPRPEAPEHNMRYSIRITDMCTLVYHNGVFLFAQLDPDREIDYREIRGRIHAYDARTGKPLWDRPCGSWGWGHPPDVFCREGLVWVHDVGNRFLVGVDLRTGTEKQRLSSFEAFDNGHHHRCYRNKATDRFVITSYRGFEFLDWQSGETQLHHWVRGTCRIGGFPCNGLLYANPHPCQCYIASKLNGMMALSPAVSPPRDILPQERLVREAAFAPDRASAPDDASAPIGDGWPLFRHDPQRSASNPVPLRPEWRKTWETQLDGPLTACTAEDGLVFTSCPDTHQVYALRAASGHVAWRFTPGGPVDTPPTFYRGFVYFGCCDGWVYCLRAADGVLAWRFLAASQPRTIFSMDRLESVWPVHGSVLVQNNTVYVAAGRSSYLDGGLSAYALDAQSGRVLAHRQVTSDYDVKPGPFAADETTEVLSDLLVASAGAVFMRQLPLFELPHAGKGQTGDRLTPITGFLDDSWFSRTRWRLGPNIDAEYLVFDEQQAYGVRARPKKETDSGFFTPASRGYELFAASRKPAVQDRPADTTPPKKKVGARGRAAAQSLWSVRVPVRVISMVLAGDTLFAAGTPDLIDAKDPWAAYEGRRGGVLLAISKTDGRILREVRLEGAPAYDGMAVASGRVFLPTQQGRLICFE